MKKVILNYLGQLRIYSLIDLVILLTVAGATKFEFIGVIFLHIGFLTYLENKHSHKERKKIPSWVWVIFLILGIFFYQHIEVIFFLICSFLYVKKNNKNWGIYAPFFRGLQSFFLLVGIVGYHNFLPWFAFLVMFLRNAIGDWRDIEKDSKEKMKTLPMILCLKKDFKKGHLIAILISTFIWWEYGHLPFSVLSLCLGIELLTYNLTPR